MMELISGILNNQKAGIMDVNLLQKQKALEADAWSWPLNDHSIFGLYAKPIAGQSLEDLHSLLIDQVDQFNGLFFVIQSPFWHEGVTFVIEDQFEKYLGSTIRTNCSTKKG